MTHQEQINRNIKIIIAEQIAKLNDAKQKLSQACYINIECYNATIEAIDIAINELLNHK